jgi:putative ABC transport system permease protein
VSIEEDFARDIGAGVGDRLTLLIGADPLEVTVQSVRSVDWQSMRPNFFMVFPPQGARGVSGHVYDEFSPAA